MPCLEDCGLTATLHLLGHGTHVAGIIGALPGKGFFNLTGVAYESELRAYKVGGCEGGLPDDGQSSHSHF